MTTMKRRGIAVILIMVTLSVIFTVGAFNMQPSSKAAKAAASDSLPIVALPGYHVSLFAPGTAPNINPDSVVVDMDRDSVYVGYQNHSVPDGSNHKGSVIVKYTLQGAVVQSYKVPGHCDGLRFDPATHYLWATSNEDANAVLTIINPTTGEEHTYPFPPSPHMGGFDDMAFINGKVFVAASNPKLNKNGINVHPAVDEIILSDGKITLKPVLMGNATALDRVTHKYVTLNEIDPDSMMLDPQGDVVLDNQAGAELVFMQHAGTQNQKVSRLGLGTQVDDSAWATTSEGTLLVVDATQNAIYAITADFTPGTIYTEAPNDSGVASFVGTINKSTGAITPVAIGFGSPTGLTFVPDADL